MKFLKNKTVVTIVAGLVCVIILGFAYKKRVGNQINETPVPVAAREILAREEITQDSVKIINVAASALTNNVIRYSEQLFGGETKKYVNFNTKIPEGSFFYQNAVVDWSSMPDSAWSEISDDNAIVSLSVNTKSTFGGSIYPGDKIDIYYHTYDGEKLVYGKLIEAITVLAVKDSSGYHIGQRSASQSEPAALIFSVPENLHLLLRKALALASPQDLVPVPRNTAYSESDIATSITSEYLQKLINDRCMDIPLDTVDTTTSQSINITE